jgi:hypothetical protein
VAAVVLAVADEGNKEAMTSEVTLAASGMVGRVIVDENVEDTPADTSAVLWRGGTFVVDRRSTRRRTTWLATFAGLSLFFYWFYVGLTGRDGIGFTWWWRTWVGGALVARLARRRGFTRWRWETELRRWIRVMEGTKSGQSGR